MTRSWGDAEAAEALAAVRGARLRLPEVTDSYPNAPRG